MSQTEIVLSIKPDGTIESPWWSPEVAEYICDLCGKKGTDECRQKVGGSISLIVCVNANPFCG